MFGPAFGSLIGTSIGSLNNDLNDNRPSTNQEIKSDRLKFTQLFHESDCNKTDSTCFTQVILKINFDHQNMIHVFNPSDGLH